MKQPNNIKSIWDNGGETIDRFSIVLNEDYHSYPSEMFGCLGLSINPTYPLGFSQFCGAMEGEHLGRKLNWDDLPIKIQTHISLRLDQDELI